MPIEPIDPTLIKIPELDPLSPLADEFLGEGDDHMRIVKNALQNTFPVIGTGACSLSADEINQSFLCINAEAHIIMYWAEDPTVVPYPEGWAACDGQPHNGITTPLIQDMFIKYATDSETVGGIVGVETHSEGLQPTVLTIDQTPVHSHTWTQPWGKGGGSVDPNGDYPEASGGDQGVGVSTEGSSSSHDHPMTYDNQPQYCVLHAITYVGIGGI